MSAGDDGVTFRHELRPGDLGWVVARHGVLYAEEYAWDVTFEAVAAEIVAKLGQSADPARERAWLAERGGQLVGCVFLERQSDEVAKLRLLLVEPAARGAGLGSRLVGECVAFARRAGYRRLTLWTMHVLLPARRIYERHGFRLVHAEPCRCFGHDLVSETWELEL
jgi:GNAT superfamily N-acetyltransferase